MSSRGVVYILFNNAMEGYVKIGRTSRNDVEKRIKELDTTALPLPFQCYFAGEVNSAADVERRLHRVFADKRVRQNREFFQVDLDQAKEALLLASPTDVTPKQDAVNDPSDLQALENAKIFRERRSRLKFSEIGVPIGAELIFSRGDNIKCTVVRDGCVKYNDEEMASSAAAYLIMRELGYNPATINGNDFWTYNNLTLTTIRKLAEENKEN